MLHGLLFVVAALLPGQTEVSAGSIAGMVVNGSRNEEPVPGVEVALRVRVDGQFVVAGETTTDARGRFRFDEIPADPDYVYLAGANWQTVHYPGQRIQLRDGHRSADVRIKVRDAIQTPDPLVVRKHEITLESRADSLRVTESLLVDNPGQTTYIGQPKSAEGRAATLTLSVPSDFVRTTFHEEFLGRRFTLIDGRLVTDVPWMPGVREVKFTYVLPVESGDRVWRRPLDLPTSDVRVAVASANPDEIVCNLKRAEGSPPGVVLFSSAALTADDEIAVQFVRRSVTLATSGRWLAFGILAVAIVGTVLTQGVRARPRTPTSAGETC